MRATSDDYLRVLQALLPPGAAWPRDPDATLTKVLAAWADDLAQRLPAAGLAVGFPGHGHQRAEGIRTQRLAQPRIELQPHRPSTRSIVSAAQSCRCHRSCVRP